MLDSCQKVGAMERDNQTNSPPIPELDHRMAAESELWEQLQKAVEENWMLPEAAELYMSEYHKRLME